MKEKIFISKNEQALSQLREIQELQLELDRSKKTARELSKKVRSLGQSIPEKIRRLKL